MFLRRFVLNRSTLEALDTLCLELTSLRALIVQFRLVKHLMKLVEAVKQLLPYFYMSEKLVYVRLRPCRWNNQNRIEGEEDSDQPELEERWMYARWTDEMIAIARSPGP